MTDLWFLHLQISDFSYLASVLYVIEYSWIIEIVIKSHKANFFFDK